MRVCMVGSHVLLIQTVHCESHLGKLTLSPFIHTTLGAGSPLMGISSRSLLPATIVTVFSGRFKPSKCTLGGSAEMKRCVGIGFLLSSIQTRRVLYQ